MLSKDAERGTNPVAAPRTAPMKAMVPAAPSRAGGGCPVPHLPPPRWCGQVGVCDRQSRCRARGADGDDSRAEQGEQVQPTGGPGSHVRRQVSCRRRSAGSQRQLCAPARESVVGCCRTESRRRPVRCQALRQPLATARPGWLQADERRIKRHRAGRRRLRIRVTRVGFDGHAAGVEIDRAEHYDAATIEHLVSCRSVANEQPKDIGSTDHRAAE